MVFTVTAHLGSVQLPGIRPAGTGKMARSLGLSKSRTGTSTHPPVSADQTTEDFHKIIAWTLKSKHKTGSLVHPAGGVRPQIGFDDRDGGTVKTRVGGCNKTPLDDARGNNAHSSRPRPNSRASNWTVDTESSVHVFDDNRRVDDNATQKHRQDEEIEAKEAKKEKKNVWKRIVRTFRRRRAEEKKERESDQPSRRNRGSHFLRSIRHSFRRKSKKDGNAEVENSSIECTDAPKRPETSDIQDATLSSTIENQLVDDRRSDGSCDFARTRRKFSLPLPYADEVPEDWAGDELTMLSSVLGSEGLAGLDTVDMGGARSPVERRSSVEEDGVDGQENETDEPDKSLEAVVGYLHHVTDMNDLLIGRELRSMGDLHTTEMGVPPRVRQTPTNAHLSDPERELLQLLRDGGDSLPDRVCNWFTRTVRHFVGDEHTWSQVQFLMRFTVMVCSTVADCGNAVPRVTSLADDFFRQTLAPWVARHGGIRNMPLDTGEVD